MLQTNLEILQSLLHTEIVKILAPLADNPNAPDKDGLTPIHAAADNGHTEIVNILAPLTANPNAADRNGDTPIHFAARKGNLDIVEILAPLTDNPNPPNRKGETPAYCIANLEIGIWKFPNLFYSYCFKFWAWSIWVSKLSRLIDQMCITVKNVSKKFVCEID